MRTIAESLLELQEVKEKLDASFVNRSKTSFTDRVDELLYEAQHDNIRPEWLAIQDLRTWTSDGQIGMIVSDFSEGLISFYVDTFGSASVNIVVNDGTSDIITTTASSGVRKLIQLPTKMAGFETYYAIKISPTTGNIARFRVERDPSVYPSVYNMPIYWFYGNLTTLTNMAGAFNNTNIRCSQLERVDIKSTSSVTSFAVAFLNCSALTHVSYLDTSNATNCSEMFRECRSLVSLQEEFDLRKTNTVAFMFFGCRALKKIPNLLTTSLITNAGYMYSYCHAIKSVPAIDTTNVNNMTDVFYECHALQSVPECYSVFTSKNQYIGVYSMYTYALNMEVLDMSAITSLLGGVNVGASLGLRRVKFNPNSTTSTFGTTAPHISIYQNNLSRDAIIETFTSLPVVSGKTIRMTAQPGSATLTADDIAIATSKGWTVTTT